MNKIRGEEKCKVTLFSLQGCRQRQKGFQAFKSIAIGVVVLRDVPMYSPSEESR